MLNSHPGFSPSPLVGILVGIEIKINAIGPLDRTATVLDPSPAVPFHIHSGTKGVILGIRSNGSILLKPRPGEYPDRHHPGSSDRIPRKKTRFRFLRFGAHSGEPRIRASRIAPGADITIPKIEFEIGPTTALPATAERATAVGGGFHHPADGLLCATTHQQKRSPQYKAADQCQPGGKGSFFHNLFTPSSVSYRAFANLFMVTI